MQKRFLNFAKVYYPKFKREEVVKVLRENLKDFRLKQDIRKAYLFGSYATKKFTVASDIDILVVVDDKVDKNKFYNILVKSLKLKGLELHILKESEYLNLKRLNSKWIKTIENEGILIWENLKRELKVK